jgi:cysteine-rich repeat protein
MLRIVSLLSVLLAVACEAGPPQPPVLVPIKFEVSNLGGSEIALSATVRIVDTDLLEATPEGPAVSDLREEQVVSQQRLPDLTTTPFRTTDVQLSSHNEGAQMELEFSVLSFGTETVSIIQLGFESSASRVLTFGYQYDQVTGQYGLAGGYVPAPVCGDGIINGTESCDDGGTFSQDGCSALCALE